MVSEFENEVLKRQAEDLRYDKLANAAKWNLCAECGGMLVVIWNGKDDEYQLKCGPNKAHIGIKSWRESPREIEREARQMAVDNKQNILAKYSGIKSLAQSEAQDIVKTLWPDAPAIEILKAAIICRQYGLNPLMRHIYLVGYVNNKTGATEWSIQIGIGATRMIARRSGAYSYEDNSPRVMTESEQVAILGEVDKTRYWAITVVRDREGMRAQGYGNWSKADIVKGGNKGNTPLNMAFIRSERAALDKLFPEKLPIGEVIAEEYIPILADKENLSIAPISPAGEGEKLAKPSIPVVASPSPSTERGKGKAGDRALAELFEDDLPTSPSASDISATRGQVGISPARVADVKAEIKGQADIDFVLKSCQAKRLEDLTPGQATSIIAQLKAKHSAKL